MMLTGHICLMIGTRGGLLALNVWVTQKAWEVLTNY
jgi:hypothetical protein